MTIVASNSSPLSSPSAQLSSHTSAAIRADLGAAPSSSEGRPAEQRVLSHEQSSQLDSPRFRPRLPVHSTSLPPMDISPRSRTASGTPRMSIQTSRPGTPRPRSADLPGPAVPITETSRPLNVTDALSYLDAVKVQFQDQPDVYNMFLDIMKDFKSQVIDTPGVISRVSQLFNGNPFLIQGFNTFLPVGYRIDISPDPRDNMITVTTPLGTTRQSTFGQHGPLGSELNIPPPPIGVLGHPSPFPIPPHLQPPSGANISRSITPHAYPLPPAPFDATYSPGFTGTTPSRNAAALLGNLNSNNPADHQSSGEFNHAIQYLNKIKARYADDQNTYKQFLEILQTHHREQRPSHNHHVHAQVRTLFKDAPDLLLEFKDFLPDVPSQPGFPLGGIGILPTTDGLNFPWQKQEIGSGATDRKKTTTTPKRKKRPVDKESTPVSGAKSAPNRSQSKKSKHSHKLDSPPLSYSPYQGSLSPQHMQMYPQTHMATYQPPQQLSHIPHSSHNIAQGSMSAPDEAMFFERVRKMLEPRETYDDFLKLLNLFHRDIIDAKTLVERAQVFLGEGDLLMQFKDILGWDDRQEGVEHGPPGSIRTGPPEALTAMPVDDGEGPSYRKLPESEVRLACSGRDELCRSVLNDEWVSHPTWASEDSGFVAHKKNSYEEALHKSEEERHEYHVHIEALMRTVAVLEPINTRIEEMTNDERSSFRLKSDFGGSSKSIYHRTIKKVYGRDAGVEVINALQDCPVVAVPVVLARLKQKDEEWRRAQREWSRTWREVDAKNFYKSLDHQGISFKANDKKNITAKHFVADIETIKKVQLSDPDDAAYLFSFARGSGGHQLDLGFQDTSVLHDALKMAYSFLDHSQAIYGPQERRSLEKFIRSFMPVLFMCSPVEFNAACGHPDDDDIVADNDVDGQRNGGRRSVAPSQAGGGNIAGVPASDLRKKLLKTAQEKVNRKDGDSSSRMASRASSPTPRNGSPSRSEVVSGTAPAKEIAEDVWIGEVVEFSSAGGQGSLTHKPERRPFFANTTFYTLLRLLHLLYSRLLLCKEIGDQLAAKRHVPLHPNPIAVELGLDDPHGPCGVLIQAMESLGGQSLNESTNVAYLYLLDAWEKVCDNELDQSTFEEHMRYFFGNKAFHVYTLDKLVTALVKQVQTIVSDNKCRELWSLLQNARSTEVTCNRDIIRYRRSAERHIGTDDPLYRIEWLSQSKTMRVQLVGVDDPSVEENRSAIARWREYADTYTMRQRTEWLPVKERENDNPLFLRKTLSAWDGPELRSYMRIRISLGTYKMFWDAGSEDEVFRPRSEEEHENLASRAKLRDEERLKCSLLQADHAGTTILS